MEGKKNVEISLVSVVLILIIILLVAGIIYVFLENQELNKQIIGYNNTNNSSSETNELNTLVSQLSNQLSEKNKTIERLEKEIDEFKNDNSEKQSINTYEIGTIKNYYDVISNNDSNLIKAQKIAKEVMNAVNNKDWYYLVKMVGVDADAFIKYGIYNYTINVDDYEEINGEYIFKEKYDTTVEVRESLGALLIISFEDGGRIVIDPNCTGI